MVVDDHAVVRSGVRHLLENADDLVVVAEAGTPSEALAACAASLPDVVVMDVRLGDESGIDATREIRRWHPDIRVLVLSTFVDDDAVVGAIMAGASGFVLKRISGDELVNSVRRVSRGESLLDPGVTGGLLGRIRDNSGSLKDIRLARLTPREERILNLVAGGLTNREIGAQLFVSEKTVRNQMSTILSKLEVARRAEAVAYLVRHAPSSIPA